MRHWRYIPVLLLAVTPCGYGYSHARRGPTAPKHSSRKAAKLTGPRAMDATRATEIQTALIKSGYLKGEPSGKWDTESEAAMQKMQADNGWQTKITPDSRALIKLGLGPKGSLTEPTAAGTPGGSPVATMGAKAAPDL